MSDCICGHPLVAHETVARLGKAWFALDAVPADELALAYLEDSVWQWCGHCEDGCFPVASPITPTSEQSL